MRSADERQRRRFGEVVLPHLDDALSLARWMTGNRPDAEDVVQESAMRALGAIDAFQGGNARAWVLTIVRNTALTWLAKNRPKRLTFTDDESVFEAAAGELGAARNPEADLIVKADGERVRKAIDGLPLNFREVVVLREIEGLGYQEIASVIGSPIGTVMSRLSRARRLLMGALAEDHKKEQGAA